MSISSSSAAAPETSWYVVDSEDVASGPVSDFELREGLLIGRWGTQAKVSVSPSGPWTAAADLRLLYLHLMQHGWYVRSESDGKVVGPFAAEKMRRLADSRSLRGVDVRCGRDGRWKSPDQYESWALPRPQIVPREPAAQPIQAKCRCPHCCHKFPSDQVRWIATDPSLRGDDVVGPEAMRRFVGTHFNVDGDALDAADGVCRRLACPRCHLEVPRDIIELQSAAISIFGAPASGRSSLLGAAVKTLPRRLADGKMLFQDSRHSEATSPDRQSVQVDGREVSYPNPRMFRWQPSPEHSLHVARCEVGRVVCLYDHAGEHFLPGHDHPREVQTEDLHHNHTLLFLLDPTQHAPIRDRLGASFSETQSPSPDHNPSQLDLLAEVLRRVRRRRGIADDDRLDTPLIVAISKFDLWEKTVEADQLPDEIEWTSKGSRAAIDMQQVARISSTLRSWLVEMSPEIVQAAEGQVDGVLYVPTSGLGSQVAARFADLPFLLAMHKASTRLLPVGGVAP